MDQYLKRLGYGLDDRGSIPAGGNDWILFLFTTASRPALGPIHSTIKWVQGTLSPGRKAAGA